MARLCCPVCRSPFGGAAVADYRCATCQVQYPVIGRVPVLVPDPLLYLCQEAAAAARYRESLERSLSGYAEMAGRKSYRSPVAGRLCRALEANLALVRAQEEALVGPLTTELLLQYAALAAPPGTYDPSRTVYGFSMLDQNYYARADWSGSVEGEAQVRAVEEVVFSQIDRHCADRESVTVLGAGTGRYLLDLAERFDCAIGIDNCYRYVDLFHRIQDGPVEFGQINLRAPVADEGAGLVFTASLPPDASSRLSRIIYPVADGYSLPIEDQSQSAIVSIFFNEIIPLHAILKEAARVLRPGGKLVCYGSLSYHFNDPLGYLMPDEARHVISAFRFRLDEESWTELPFFAFSDIGLKRIFRIWSYVATRE